LSKDKTRFGFSDTAVLDYGLKKFLLPVCLVVCSLVAIVFGPQLYTWVDYTYPKITQEERDKHVLVSTTVSVDTSDEDPYGVSVTLTFPEGSALYTSKYVPAYMYGEGFALEKVGVGFGQKYRIVDGSKYNPARKQIVWFGSIEDRSLAQIRRLISNKGKPSTQTKALLSNQYTQDFRFHTKEELTSFVDAINDPQTWNIVIPDFKKMYDKAYNNIKEAEEYKAELEKE
jgi:hypothetical protein